VELKSGSPLRSKGFQIIPDGERLVLHLPGGGGMGDPATRDPMLVAADVRDGLVSVGSAEREYRVALEPNGAVDYEATSRLRRRS
jgi:N-methylhydantoinase B